MIVRLLLTAFAAVVLALFFASSAYCSTSTVLLGQSINFAVSADGTTPFSFQWFKDGAMIAGATEPTYSVNGVQPTDAGDYYAVVLNSAGNTTSDTATIVVDTTPVAPTFTIQLVDQTVTSGGSASFT